MGKVCVYDVPENRKLSFIKDDILFLQDSLSHRTYSSLSRKAGGYISISYLVSLIESEGFTGFVEVRNFGETSYSELVKVLTKKGYLHDLEP